jgi:hypothetical protein
MHEPKSSNFNRHAWLSTVIHLPVSDASKLVATALWHFSNESGFCWPNQDQIAQTICHKSIGRISQYTAELASAGVIRIDYVQGNGKFKSANYQLITPTDVGNNLLINNYINNVQGLKTLEHINSNGKLVPTSVGTFNNINGKLMPTYVGTQTDSLENYVVDGRDLRPPPPWAGVSTEAHE